MRIPKYIDENIFPHVALAPISQQAPGAYGYTFRVYRPSNAHYLGTFEQNVEKLLAWSRREHADAYEVEKHYFTTKEHRKPYYRRDYILVVIYGADLGELSVVTDKAKFEQTLAVIETMPSPAVNSVPVYEEEIQPDRDKAITGFRFLGQRFTVDAGIFQRLMDRETEGRMLPNALDIPAALGSTEAYDILKSDYGVGNYAEYEPNLADARAYVQAVEDGVWTSNLYWSWLNMLRPLADEADMAGYPFFMQNAAWARKELNTFLGSWIELKYDTLLYAKQPMGEMGGGGMEAPPPPDDRGYVEPNPELFGRLALLVRQTRDGLTAAGLITGEADASLASLGEMANTLTAISQKELANTALTTEEYDFIRNYGASLEHIWDSAKKDDLAALEAEYGYANRQSYLFEHPDAIVADVATDPNGVVLEEATAPYNYAKQSTIA